MTSSYVYDAFGTLQSQGTPETKYLYRGQQFDQDTGLYSLRARYYNPGAGRFLSMDTWAYNLQNPFELNRYAYVANNPVNWSDPSGYSALFDYVKMQVNNMGYKQAIRQYLVKPFLIGFVASVIGYGIGTAAGILFKAAAMSMRRYSDFSHVPEFFAKEWSNTRDSVTFVPNLLIAGLLGGITNIGNTIGAEFGEELGKVARSTFKGTDSKYWLGISAELLPIFQSLSTFLFRNNAFFGGLGNGIAIALSALNLEYKQVEELVFDLLIAVVGTYVNAVINQTVSLGGTGMLKPALNKIKAIGGFTPDIIINGVILGIITVGMTAVDVSNEV